MRRAIALLSLALAVLVPAAAQAAPHVLRLGALRSPQTLNPLLAVHPEEELVIQLVYEPLLGYDARLAPAPVLAARWEVDGSGTVWRFHLRGGERWPDGRALTADQVRLALEAARILGSGLFGDRLAQVSAITAQGSRLEIRLREPAAVPPALGVPVIPPELVEEALGRGPAGVPAGTGPYGVAELAPGVRVRLRARQGYRSGRPAADEIVLQAYADAEALADALASGHVDAALHLPPARLSALAGLPGVRVVQAAPVELRHLAYRLAGHPWLGDRRVRLALDLALDRQGLVERVWGGLAQPGDVLLPPALGPWRWDPPPAARRTHDPQRARALLQQVGLGSRTLSLRLYAPAGLEDAERAAGEVARQWQRIGVEAQVAVLEPADLSRRMLAGDFDVVLWGWGADPDPTPLLSLLSAEPAGGLADHTGYANPEYDRLLRAQRQARDPAARREMVRRMQRLLYEDVPYSVLYYPPHLQGYREDRFQGWQRIPPPDGPVLSPHTPAGVLGLTPSPPAGPLVPGVAGTAAAGTVAAAAVLAALAAGRRRGPARPGRPSLTARP